MNRRYTFSVEIVTPYVEPVFKTSIEVRIPGAIETDTLIWGNKGLCYKGTRSKKDCQEYF